MAEINITLDVPFESEVVNLSALKSELTAFAKILLSSPSILQPKQKVEEVDPFSELDTNWGGARDANDIAEELHNMRFDERTIEGW